MLSIPASHRGPALDMGPKCTVGARGLSEGTAHGRRTGVDGLFFETLQVRLLVLASHVVSWATYWNARRTRYVAQDADIPAGANRLEG